MHTAALEATTSAEPFRDAASFPLLPEHPGQRPLGSWADLIHAAVDSDDPADCIAAAARALGGPVGFAAPAGRVLGHAPRGPGGRRAAAVAAAAAAGQAAPPGWRVLPVIHAAARMGVLAVGPMRAHEPAEPMIDLVATLLGEQLKRSALVHAQRAALLRRLVGVPGADARRLRRDAAAVGLALQDDYWPAILVWDLSRTHAGAAERVRNEAVQMASGALATSLGRRTILLHPGATPGPAVRSWLTTIVELVRASDSGSGAFAILGEEPAELAEVAAQVAHLAAACELGRRGADAAVVSAREYGLDRLLQENVPSGEARRFVDDRVGALIAWDREHGSDLLLVLEAALDLPRLDQAAQRCFMHRNTFRQRLKLALEVLGESLDEPNARLAAHVALKLRAGRLRLEKARA
jgi:sugar diacid utilization regulator